MIKKTVVFLIFLFVGLAAILMFAKEKKINNYERTNEILHNPYMGFAPCADEYEAVGDNTLVYVDVMWKEFETEKGKYDFDAIAKTNYLDEWKRKGKNVVLRFICDYPSAEAHRDIPDWLYELTGDGSDYDCAYGKGYSPKYENEIFIEYHNLALKELADCFNVKYGEEFIAYVELGSLGHWGEWHVKYDEGIEKFPAEETCRRYVEGYLDAFPNTMLMMRRPFSFVSEYNMGVFNDVAGDVYDTNEWLSWINGGGEYSEAKDKMQLIAVPKVYEKAAVGGELTSRYTLQEHLTDNLKENIREVRNSHTTFLGPNCPSYGENLKEYKSQADELLKNMGYRYVIDKTEISAGKYINKNITVKVNFTNLGPAPLYKKMPITLYVLDDNRNVLEEILAEDGINDIYDGETKTITWTLSGKKYELDNLHLAIGMGIDFASSMEHENKLYYLTF